MLANLKIELVPVDSVRDHLQDMLRIIEKYGRYRYLIGNGFFNIGFSIYRMNRLRPKYRHFLHRLLSIRNKQHESFELRQFR